MLKGKIPFRTISPDTSASARSDPLSRLIIDTAYDQTRALDVPVFDPGAKLRVGAYLEEAADGVPLGPGLPPGLAEAAAAVRRVLASTHRLEPLNNTPIHRSYPSPRSLYPVSVDFVFARTGEEIRLRYDAEHHALLGDRTGLDIGHFGLRLEIVGVLERISPLYGDLGPTLCAIEAGHLAAQLRDALVAAGLSPDGQFAGTTGAAQQVGSRELADFFLVATLEWSGEPIAWSVTAADDVALRVTRPKLDAADRDRVARAYTRLASPPLPAIPMPAPPSDGLVCGLEAAASIGRLRSSGHFPAGISGEPLPPAEIDAFAQYVTQLYGTGVLMPHLQLHLLCPLDDGAALFIATDQPNGGEPVRDGRAKLAAAFGSAYNIDLATIPLFAIFSADIGAILRGRSSWAWFQTLAAAGQLAQHVCVAAAERGWFCRPFKGVLSHELESGFPITGQVFYALILGRRTSTNYSLSLGQVEAAE